MAADGSGLPQAPKPRGPGGQPTKYRPQYCELVIELGKLGFSQAQMAAHIGVAKGSLNAWCAQHPEFLNALMQARTHSQAWWESEAMLGLKNRDFNAAVWHKSVASRFREDYGDRITQELTGADGGPIQIEGPSDAEVARRVAFMLMRSQAEPATIVDDGNAA